MSVDRIVHLEQALLAVIAAAGERGVNTEDLCMQAIGGLIGNRTWRWVTAEYIPGATDEIESALRVLQGQP